MTLYYDTHRFASFAEKSNGDFSKAKFRLRWYEPDPTADAEYGTAFVEVKRKAGDGRSKERVKLRVPRARLAETALDAPWWQALLLESGLPSVTPFRTDLSPTVLLRYQRRRFLCPVTLGNVCLDSDIGVARFNAARLFPLEPLELQASIVEFKDTDRIMPSWMRPLQRAGYVRQGFSKYAECIRRLTREV